MAVRSGLLAFIVALSQIQGSGSDDAKGIRWLSDESYTRAIECGRSGSDCAIVPYRLCSGDLQAYTAWIATPFSRVAASVSEAIRRGQRVRPMDQDAANGWGVGIYVSPADNADNSDEIRNVILSREGRTIRPLTSTIAPVTAERSDGTPRHLAKGFFAFPIDDFLPTVDTTVVFTGSAGEARCTLSVAKLAALR